MAYPFFYSLASSVLKKLDQCILEGFQNRNDIKNKDVEMLKGILIHLPSIIETEESAISVIRESLYGLLDLLNEQLHSRNSSPSDALRLARSSSLNSIVGQLSEFQDYIDPRCSTKDELRSFVRSMLKINSLGFKVDKFPLHLVPCLAYCALYPKGYRIVRETLVNLWIVEGFLELQTAGSSSGSGSGSGDMELEDTGNCCFMELLSMGVFIKPVFGFGGNSSTQQAVTIHSCEIHPLIHEVACRIAREEVLVLRQQNSDFKTHATNYIAFHQDVSMPSFPSARTCMYFIPEIKRFPMGDVKKRFSGLQILDLAGTEFEELPKKFRRSLWQLRYLAFSRNALLRRVQSSGWRSLQTLAVDGCVQLKELDVKYFKCLRHLYYTSKESTLKVHNSTLRILQLSQCLKLRLLSLSNLANFTALRKLRLFECPGLVSLPDSTDLLPSVVELVFHNCALLDLNYGRSMDSLPSLQYVELIGLPQLTELPAGFQSARALSYLMIADCKRLTSTDHVLQHLDSLQKLCVYNCPILRIKPHVFQSLTALQLLDIRKCLNTSASDASKDLAPFISHIPEVIFDGQLFLNKKADWSNEIDADLQPQIPSSSAQTDSYLPRNYPFFILSLETYKAIKTPEGMIDQVYKLKVPSRWVILALALRAIVNLRALQRLRRLHCCLFPTDFEFERDTLVQSWMAGLYLKAWKHHANNHFDRLLDEGYISYSRTDILTGISKYKVNAGKVISVLNKDRSRHRFTLIEDENIGMDKATSWHVSIASTSVSETMFETLKRFSELKTLILIRDYGSSLKKIPSKFFTALQSMQVLDLSGCHITELPSSIGDMKLMRFLDLSFTLIERIPESIRLLLELGTLKLKGCEHLHTLPKGMKELVNLCHLDFDVLGQLTSMPKGLGSLTNLCTLSAFIVSFQGGCSIRELKNMNKLCGSLCISGLEYAIEQDAEEAALREKKHLTRLHYKWNDSKCYDINDQGRAVSTLKFLKPPTSLVELQISDYPGLQFPSWIQHKDFEELVSITLTNCGIDRFSLPEQLPKLRHLYISEMNSVTEIDACAVFTSVRFPKLQTLAVEGMLKLQGWTGVQVGDYPCLSKLSMKHCPKLPGLPFLPILYSLKYLEISHCKSFNSLPEGKLSTSLETLMIDNCPLLKMRCSMGGDWKKIEDVPNIWINMKDIRSAHEDTDSISEDEYEFSDDSD